MKKKTSVFYRISTPPDPDSTKWLGTERSLISTALLWGLWLCRLFSMLQIVKLITRSVLKRIHRSSTDKNSTRINVPPLVCELYFIAWFALLLTGYLLSWRSAFFTLAILYYLFESVVWVLYYTIFRRFFEENYSIYHELEYLSVLFFIIPTQALGLAVYYSASFLDIISGLLGFGSDALAVPVRLLGALFSAIVIGTIISAFPTEKVKQKEQKKQMHIIGCGDVVTKRLYPALLKSGIAAECIHTYDLDTASDRVSYCDYYQDVSSLCNSVLAKTDRQDCVAWIETPSFTHLHYVKTLLETDIPLIVVEKPICSTKNDLDYTEGLIADPSCRERLFFLSYYILEKALPLYYLTEQKQLFDPYLSLENKFILQDWRRHLGTLKSIEVLIWEGTDSRPWTYNTAYGGQCIETFLHNVLIAALFAGLPKYWSEPNLRVLENGNDISLSAKSGQAEIYCSLKKNLSSEDCKRYAKISFENGIVFADFEEQAATLSVISTGQISRIAVKKQFLGKYAVQTDLVMRTATEQIKSEAADGLYQQIETIRWLLDLWETRTEADI